jgi:probable F420-dependent oxidoreductase
MQLGSFGVRSVGLRTVSSEEAVDAARELEELGYGTVWIGAMPEQGLEDRIAALLGATRSLVVATGVASIWAHPAPATAAMFARLDSDFPGRFLLGIGVSHEPLVAQRGGEYRKPLSAMNAYLDDLDAAAPPVPADRRILAALAPKMLQVARARSLGSYPFLIPPAQTAWTREQLGDGPLLAPDVKVVLDSDPVTARAAAREAMRVHLTLPNYLDNMRRSGFEDADFVDGGSDRLVDGLVAWGDVEAVRAMVDRHRAAGADHVVLDPVAPEPLPRDAWRRLAPAA